jgi:hypothetical protein
LGIGCIERPLIVATPDRPPRSLKEITQALEENSRRLDRPVWSTSVTATARIRDDKSREHVFNLEGTLLFDKPRNLRMDLRPSLGEPAIGIGSNDEEFWAWIEPEMHAMRWGKHRNAGRSCAGRMTIRADQIIAAMGLGGFPPAEAGLVGPARKYGKHLDILTYLRKNERQEYLIDREYWVDRDAPFLTRVVVLRDEFGRQMMSSLLDDYRPVWPDGPLAPHTVSIDWPLDQTRFTMQVAAFKPIERTQLRPTTFTRPQGARLPKGVSDIIQIDADCDNASKQ